MDQRAAGQEKGLEEGPAPPAKARRRSRRYFLTEATGEVEQAAGWAKRAFDKFNNDWTMNLVSLVAFNLLISFFPILLVLFTLLALIPAQSGHAADFAAQVNRILPPEVARSVDVASLLSRIRGSFGVLSILSIAALIWSGSNLFGAIENAFAVIYRVRTRDLGPRTLMSLVMILLFAILLPLSFISSVILGAGTTALGAILPETLSGPIPLVLGVLTSLVSLFILFLAIYVVVPNIPISFSYAWRGALVAAACMVLVNTAFPFYTAHFVGIRQYGAAAIGTVLVTITWFWFFSLVLLVGAQANSLAMDLKPWPRDIAHMLVESETPPRR